MDGYDAWSRHSERKYIIDIPVGRFFCYTVLTSPNKDQTAVYGGTFEDGTPSH